MHIGLVIWSLFENRGGIERNCCHLAAAMLERSHEVSIFYKVPASSGARAVYPVPAGARMHALPLERGPRGFVEAKGVVADSGIDVLAAFFSWESLLWFPGLLKDTGIPLLVSEESAPDRIVGKWNALERLCCLRCADAIHVLLDAFLPAYPPDIQARITIIPNPALCPEPVERLPRDSGKRILLGAGRFLDQVKQFSLLIRAFAMLKDDFPEWQLVLCGDGPSMPGYAKLLGELDLRHRVECPGMVEDVQPFYGSADLFCIPSRVEGFGIVTIEAQCHALPVVGFAACPGTNEIVIHDQNGLLAEEMTVECLAGCLRRLMADETLRMKMGRNGREGLARYCPDKVYAAWEDLLAATAKRKGQTRIQEYCSDSDLGCPEREAVCELLERSHPFDRRRYIQLHRDCLAEAKPSPFTERQVAGFRKKQSKYGLGGTGFFRQLLQVLGK